MKWIRTIAFSVASITALWLLTLWASHETYHHIDPNSVYPTITGVQEELEEPNETDIEFICDANNDSFEVISNANLIVEFEIPEPNESDIENARKLGNLLINYADYAQGIIDENEYVRRGMSEGTWEFVEPNEPKRLIEFEYSTDD